MARIKYGVSNVHYAVATTDATTGAITYGEVKPLPGCVSLTLDQQGESVDEYADNILWFHMDVNNGYSGNIEFEELPESFRTDVLGEEKDKAGVLWESADAGVVEFALLFQFEIGGDPAVNGKRGCMMRCTASRPSIAGTTKEATITPQHETLNLTAMPRIADHIVKASCESTSDKYAGWFTAVPEKTA